MAEYSALFTGQQNDNVDNAHAVNAPYKILFVDDEPNILSAIKRIFRQENYQIFTAVGGQEALEILADDSCHVVISDFKMPKMNGGELLRTVKKLYPDMIRIMLTGHADADAVMSAIKEGAVYKFILKPWNDDDLRVTIGLALEQYDLIQRNRILEEQNRHKSKEISKLARIAVTNRSQLAILLHKRNLLNDRQLQEIYKIQQTKKLPTVSIILDREWVSEQEIRRLLNTELLIDEVSLNEFQVDPAVSSLIPRKFCEQQMVLPLKKEANRLMLVMADPMDMGLINDLKFTIGLDIQTVMANIEDIRGKIEEVYGEQGIDFSELEIIFAGDDPLDGIEIIIDDDDDLTVEELLRSTDEPPAIRLVNVIILEAIRLGASDIHIQPRTKGVVVRYRIDGILVDKIQIPLSMHMSLVSRIKIMAELDIAERRRPQDGRITVKTPMRVIDLRISSLPTINGEKLVLRILDRNATIHGIEQLGFEPENFRKISSIIKKPQGLILATGPTGSGKTTTLYSLMQHEATSEKNYVTIEDPVEYYLDMAGQIMVKDKIGLDFATILRAILRQDPDVILLGEIRDHETAEVALHAALTGHLVFSTLHTNSATSTLARLYDLGLKPFAIATAVEAIIAQRLVRKICDECREPYDVSQDKLESLGPFFEDPSLQTFQGTGCKKCGNSGYSGRIGIYEVLIPNLEMQGLIAADANMSVLDQVAKQSGMKPLIEDASIKVNKGLTTVDEILRVLGPQYHG